MYVYEGRSCSKLRENGVLLEQLERDGLQIRTKQNKTFSSIAVPGMQRISVSLFSHNILDWVF